jgi:hypothetical protein
MYIYSLYIELSLDVGVCEKWVRYPFCHNVPQIIVIQPMSQLSLDIGDTY